MPDVEEHTMSDPIPISRSNTDPVAHEQNLPDAMHGTMTSSNEEFEEPPTPGLTPALTPAGYLSSSPGSPMILSRNSSYFGSQSADENWDLPPPERLSFFDLFDTLAIPGKFDRWQSALSAQKEKLQRQQERMRQASATTKDKAVAEWRKRVPTSDEQLAKYRRRIKGSVDQLNRRWNDVVTISVKEKVSFISAVLNIFISGYLMGAVPQYFYLWFTAQLLYFMPIRWYTYQKKGYHYFLADLCYFVNFLLCLSIWVFPKSKRLFLATYCLAYGNNAWAIVMWRNSLVFHSLDKITSLFIHLMPPVALHCLVHLTPSHYQHDRFPAIFDIIYSPQGAPEHYTLGGMLLWATLPYLTWQLSYHFFISVRRRQKIAAGRPTSFTWLRRSYAKTWIGKWVLGLPSLYQEPAFMMIQYVYACLTMLPCPMWFWYRWGSAGFLLFVFVWSVWNGANYYMDVFGKRFQKELEQLKADVAKVQQSPGSNIFTPSTGPVNDSDMMDTGKSAKEKNRDKRQSIDAIPLLDDRTNGRYDDESTARVTGAEILNDGRSMNGSTLERKPTLTQDEYYSVMSRTPNMAAQKGTEEQPGL